MLEAFFKNLFGLQFKNPALPGSYITVINKKEELEKCLKVTLLVEKHVFQL